MDRNYVVQHNLVERYLRGELDESTREAFEIHYLEHPETLRELQVYEALRAGMKQLAEEEGGRHPQIPSLSPAPSPVRVEHTAMAANQPWLPAPLLAACMAMLSVATTTLWLWNQSKVQDLRAELASAAVVSLASPGQILTFDTRRGSHDLKQKALNDQSDGILTLVLEAPPLSDEELLAETPAKEFLLTLERLNESAEPTLVRRITLKSGSNNEVVLNVAHKLLQPGVYHVEVSAPNGEGRVDYRFEVLAEGGAVQRSG